jgi:hypothetical protein
MLSKGGIKPRQVHKSATGPNPLQAHYDFLAILSSVEFQRVMLQMNNACLDCSLREGRADDVCETFDAVQNSNQDIFLAPILEIIHSRQPDLGGLTNCNLQAQNLTFAFWRDTQSNVSSFIFELPAFSIANFDPERVKENDRIHWLQSPVPLV